MGTQAAPRKLRVRCGRERLDGSACGRTLDIAELWPSGGYRLDGAYAIPGDPDAPTARARPQVGRVNASPHHDLGQLRITVRCKCGASYTIRTERLVAMLRRAGDEGVDLVLRP